MSDEFDDVPDPVAVAAAPSSAGAKGRAPRLLARLYGSANHALRTRLVAWLGHSLGVSATSDIDALLDAARLAAAAHPTGVGAFSASVAVMLAIELGRGVAPRKRADQAAA